MHGRWNRGSRGSSCSPNFWHGRAGHSSCSPKSLSLLHCNVRLSRIDSDILRVLPPRRTFKNQKADLTPHQGLCPWTPLRAPPQTPVIGSRSTRSPWPRPLLAPPTFKHFQRPWAYVLSEELGAGPPSPPLATPLELRTGIEYSTLQSVLLGMPDWNAADY